MTRRKPGVTKKNQNFPPPPCRSVDQCQAPQDGLEPMRNSRRVCTAHHPCVARRQSRSRRVCTAHHPPTASGFATVKARMARMRPYHRSSEIDGCPSASPPPQDRRNHARFAVSGSQFSVLSCRRHGTQGAGHASQATQTGGWRQQAAATPTSHASRIHRRRGPTCLLRTGANLAGGYFLQGLMEYTKTVRTIHVGVPVRRNRPRHLDLAQAR